MPGPLMSIWLVAPVGAIVVVVLGLHLGALRVARLDERRRRIRIANAVLMLALVPLLVHGLGVATTSAARSFVLSWTVITALVLLMILLALLDAAHTLRLYRRDARHLRAQARTMARAEAEE